ncbi:MAG: prenyltransferase/squalene oxidase repeat-containing protein [Phycisphaerae bacterium]|jgi:hypothetical protein|nr:prenyltransferase/squalene oxidase repeat-containing protein [Phycisphaerae bacterium]
MRFFHRFPKVVLLLLSLWFALTGCVNQTGSNVKAPGNNALEPAVAESMTKGAKALLQRQHADDGSWGGDDVKEQTSHKSDYPVAISSLAYLALMTVAPDDNASVQGRAKTLRFILETIIDDGKMKNTRDNTPKIHERNVWSQGFCTFVFGRVLRRGNLPGEMQEQIRTKARAMVAALQKTQQPDGGWTYDKGPSESFLTATVLAGLISIQEAKVAIPQTMIARSKAFLKSQSNPGNYVAYQGVPKVRDSAAKIRDSAGRSVQLELTLLQAGDGSVERLTAAAETFFKYRERLDKVLRLEKGCHQKPYRIGTFYCFYAYYHLAQALERLGGDVRRKYRPILVDHFLKLQKADGHWIDSKDHCGESYGTAMGLLVLSAPAWADTTH